jgi:hypothetical protein
MKKVRWRPPRRWGWATPLKNTTGHLTKAILGDHLPPLARIFIKKFSKRSLELPTSAYF